MDSEARELVLGIVVGLRGEKRAAKASAAGKALELIRGYLGRGKKLRGALRDATAFNDDLAYKAQRFNNLRGSRDAAAAILRGYRPFLSEMRELAASGRTLGYDELKGLRHRLLNNGAFRMEGDTRGVIPAMANIGSPAVGPGSTELVNGTLQSRYRVTPSDIDIVKKFLKPSLGVNRETRSKFKALEQYLGANSAKDTDAIRRELRRYYLANAAGVAGAGALGGAGYGAYRAVSGSGRKGGST
jgi:hypothetical protein